MSGGYRESTSTALGHPDIGHPGYYLVGAGVGADHAD